MSAKTSLKVFLGLLVTSFSLNLYAKDSECATEFYYLGRNTVSLYQGKAYFELSEADQAKFDNKFGPDAYSLRQMQVLAAFEISSLELFKSKCLAEKPNCKEVVKNALQQAKDFAKAELNTDVMYAKVGLTEEFRRANAATNGVRSALEQKKKLADECLNK